MRISIFVSLFVFNLAMMASSKGSNRFFKFLKTDPEMTMDTEELLKYWGYPVEPHELTTSDNYILTIFRIPYGKNQNAMPSNNRPVVLFGHGLFCSSEFWILNLRQQNAPMIFADAGHDVWLGNVRGNKYGKRHTYLTPEKNKKEFWDFSWSEMATIDLPETIKYIIDFTKAPYLYYIGHSLGTLTGFVGFSENQEIAQKVKKFYALGPVLQLNHVKGAMRIVAKFRTSIDRLMRLTGQEEVLAPTWFTRLSAKYVCAGRLGGKEICSHILYMIVGPCDLNKTRVHVYLHRYPAGTSRRTFVHMGQIAGSGKLAQFDFKKAENMKRYGTPTPREYDITQMKTPVALYWSTPDWFSGADDVLPALPKLTNIFANVDLGDFHHMDFIWSPQARKRIYIPIRKEIYEDFYGVPEPFLDEED